MSSLEERVAALEARWAAIEDRVTMEAGLRAAGDRDLASLGQTVKAMNHLLQAIAITQSEQGEALSQVQRVQGEHGTVMGRIVGMLDELIRRDRDDAGPPATE